MDAENPTILVVDDTEDNLDLLEFALKRKPVTMLRASSGMECLTLAAQYNPDVILLDIQMPEMDGFETLKRLRANPKTEKIPVVFLTAQKKDPLSIEHGLMMGADEYLTKPIDTEELIVRTRTLVRMKRIEKELERTKADFMAMLVHDLRSPLGGVKSVLELLNEVMVEGQPFEKAHKELVDSALEASQRMLVLISDLLDLSKYEAGSINLSKRAIPVKDIVDAVLRSLMVQVRQKNIEIKSAYAENLPPLFVDPQKADQVFSNLLSNALKFTPHQGNIVIEAGVGPAPVPGADAMIQVTIRNSGPGILPSEIPLLFNRYRQVSSAKKAKEKGTGLGLAICKLVVEAHGGIISAESDPGKWTTFRFTLPMNTAV